MSDQLEQQQQQQQQQQPNDQADVAQDVVQVNGEEQVEDQPEAVPLPPVTIRFPSPTCSRTVPKPKESSESRDQLTIYPQPSETMQDIKLLINDWVGAYWLGPYSLRLPFVKGDDGRGKVFTKKEDLSEIRAGEKLNEWLEVQDAFAHLEEDSERVLEVVREPYGEFTARQSVLRLLELIAPTGSTANTTATHISLQPGSTIFESVRDGVLSSSGETQYEEVEVSLPSGRKGKAGKKELVKVKRAISSDKSHAFSDWKGSEGWTPTSLGELPFSQSPLEVSPCLRSIQISPFNPPPPHLRQLGHQLYLQVALLEGETVTVICTTRGWFVSKSNVNQFDPSPKSDNNGVAPQPTHSLIDLLHSLSPLFSERLSKLTPLSTEPPSLDPISTVAIPQAEPAYPWLANIPKPATSAEILRTQLAFLHTGAYGADSVDAARDWNEEIQGIRELPRGSMQERVFREKMLQKVWSEFDQASIRAVQTVSRGDIPAINPSEDPKAHMYLQSNIFITQGDSDALNAYGHLGGDAAMRISHGKDAAGVKLLNKLDVDGLYMLGHTIVDWQGKRWICQSILPGIFSNRKKDDDEEEAAATEEGEGQKEKKEDWVKVGDSPTKSADKSTEVEESQDAEGESENPMMIYGIDSEKPTSIHWDKTTHKFMSTIGQAQKLAAHKIKDGKGQEFEFYASSEVKGLKGTDGRRYLLDAQRLSPVDIEWLEKDCETEGARYPHRLTMLRPELLETFWESELKRWARGVAEKAKSKQDEAEKSKEAGPSTTEGEKKEAAAAHRAEEEKPVDASVIGDIKQFELKFNPDAFVDQIPLKDAPTSDDKPFLPSTITDEADPSIKAVRDASVFLRSIAIPAVVLDVLTGNTSGLMDGASLTKHLHGRGINMRYLGHLANTIKQFSAGPEGEERKETGHLAALKAIVFQEMIFRASKHILRSLISSLQPETVSCAISHFLNCLLGSSYNSSPSATFNPIGISEREEQPEYTKLTPESLRKSIIDEIKLRFRFTLDETHFDESLKKRQLLRELAVRFGIQLAQRDYIFDQDQETSATDDEKEAKSSKDKKNKKSKVPVQKRVHTFEAEDVLTLVPVVKSTAPTVTVAEEILEAGRNTINRGSIDLGLEFMLEGLQLYENIYSVIHPEVASVYNQYSQAIHQLARLKIQQVAAQAAANPEGASDPEQPLGLDISTALRLQRQAIIVAERTLGVYHHETAGYYFNLAMLENLEGNPQQALRYFRHVLKLWDVIHGPNHPEINTVLSNAGVVLQAINETSLALVLQKQAYESTLSLFGDSHIQTGQALHQLTQSHFLAGDMAAALSTSEKALDIFNARLGEDHSQTQEVKKNVELLRAVIDNVEKQKERNEQMKKDQQERLKAAKERIQLTGGGVKGRRLGSTLSNAGSSGSGVRIVDPATLAAAAAAAGHPIDANGQPAAAAAAGVEGQGQVAEGSNIGTRGTESVEELVRFIQGQQQPGASAARRGKNALRGKRRTGAKR
uniref:Clustered mitochondria protein homolog n=1 Tax=Kwoniella bestiolae CBS 10118 TaxID=1296100 RepID=A0A1B9GBU2_9TREE|nr:protein TIF31 [Kwoniella bestiolae CBS 10118]OCF28490.1 protein TIF31 [Kwoniella bestiolae CBS 10118]